MSREQLGIWGNDLLTALALLTRLPVPVPAASPANPRSGAQAAWAYPLVGVVVGGLVSIAVLLAGWLGLPVAAAALLGLLVGVFCTGGLHEDGLADCADGFWGGWTAERRLEIMKDSQIGTYGVIALIGSFGLRWAALSAVIASGNVIGAVIGAAVISRGAMVGMMFMLPNARATGLSHQTGRPGERVTLVAAGFAMAAIVFLTPAPIFWLLMWALVATLGFVAIARFKIRGQTGDVLGATQQIVEVTVLLCCVASMV